MQINKSLYNSMFRLMLHLSFAVEQILLRLGGDEMMKKRDDYFRKVATETHH